MESKPPALSVTIITLNEEKDLPRALKSVSWADEVVVVDCGSTDQTVAIAQKMGAKVVHNPWPGYGKQKNFAQDQCKNTWVLNIDADEEVSSELKAEIKNTLSQNSTPYGYKLPRKTFYLGRWIMHGGWYPNYLTRLVHRDHARWTEPHVHEELDVQGEVAILKSPLHHYTFQGIEDQVATNLKYARFGSLDLEKKGKKPSLLHLILKPVGKFLETYLLKRGFLDGLPGFIISINAAHSIFLKYAYLMEVGLTKENRS